MKPSNSIEFPFNYAVLPHFGKVFYPLIPASLKTSDKGWVDFRFVVDTGADLTTLPFFMAQKLGVNLKCCRRGKAEGIGGLMVNTWETKIPIRLKEFEFLISCSIVEDEVTPFLLGRIDVLEKNFSLFFDCQQRKIVFQKLEGQAHLCQRRRQIGPKIRAR